MPWSPRPVLTRVMMDRNTVQVLGDRVVVTIDGAHPEAFGRLVFGRVEVDCTTGGDGVTCHLTGLSGPVSGPLLAAYADGVGRVRAALSLTVRTLEVFAPELLV